jgi:2'-5' RNA ligase
LPDSLRCFIAIKIPLFESLRPVLKALGRMGGPVKAVDAENLHVTLKFLGNTAADLVPQIVSLLQQAASGVGTPCVFDVRALGAFPHAERPQVIWAGLEGIELLSTLAGDLETGLEPLGFAREGRPFAPHLTLARIKARPPQALHDLLARHRETAFGRVEIRDVELMQSEPGSEGVRYTVLATTPFGD